MIIGLDLDNTIIRYDALFVRLAGEMELLGDDILQTVRTKKGVRDAIWAEAGDAQWIRLQARVYGPRMKDAELADGVETFLHLCRKKRVPVRVVSHKTEFAAGDTRKQCSLREMALSFLADKGFFAHGLLHREQVRFESTRRAKLERIRSLGCTHFVDDMMRILGDPEFPEGVERFLYSPDMNRLSGGGIRVCRSWEQVGQRIFSQANEV